MTIDAGAAWTQNAAQTRDQIREQVRRDVERALQSARTARQEAGQLAVPPPGAPGADPQMDMVPVPAPPPPTSVIVTSTGQPMIPFTDIPPRVEEVALAFFFTVAAIFIGTPLARAFARRIDRKAVAPAATSPEVVMRLDRIEQAVDAIALETERISEGQRYVTKVVSEARALPAPNEAAAHELRMAERGAAERAAAPRVP